MSEHVKQNNLTHYTDASNNVRSVSQSLFHDINDEVRSQIVDDLCKIFIRVPLKA